MVSLRTRLPPGVDVKLGLVGTIWELMAHSEGLISFSPNRLQGEERGVPWGVTITEEVLGVGGREGVSG